MQIVQAIADADVLDALGQPAYVLRAGRKYVLYDQEAGFALRDGAVRLVASLDRVLAPYDREPLARHRLILLFIGRRGDAIVAASCVAAMKEKYPDVTVDVAGLSASREVFRLAPVFGELRPYPVEFDRFDTYDYYLSFEEVEAIPDGSRRSCSDVFSAC